HRHGHAAHLFGAVVELADKLADVHAVLTQRRSHGRRRRRLTARHLQLNLADYLLGHARPLVISHSVIRDPLASIPIPRVPGGRRSLVPHAPALWLRAAP